MKHRLNVQITAIIGVAKKIWLFNCLPKKTQFLTYFHQTPKKHFYNLKNLISQLKKHKIKLKK